MCFVNVWETLVEYNVSALEEDKGNSASTAGQSVPQGLVFGDTTLSIVFNNLCHFVYCFSASCRVSFHQLKGHCSLFT